MTNMIRAGGSCPWASCNFIKGAATPIATVCHAQDPYNMAMLCAEYETCTGCIERPEIGSNIGNPYEYIKLNGTFLPFKTSLISFLQYT